VRSAVFLDRDGVLNEALVDNRGVPHPPSSVAELRIVEGAADACRQLREAGYALVVVTNQPDVARGTVSQATVDAINAEIRRELEVDDIRVCFHDTADECDCRKPAPGLLLQACEDLSLDPTSSFMVGDRWVDVEAGRRAGCRTVLIDRPYSAVNGVDPSYKTDSLLAAVGWILHDERLAEEEEGA
jgi:D-glycero-D-manno-heptose 1,7-bisphosphate phosphatase